MPTIQEEAQALLDSSTHKRQVEQTAERLDRIAEASKQIDKWQKEIEEIAIAPLSCREGECRLRDY